MLRAQVHPVHPVHRVRAPRPQAQVQVPVHHLRVL